MARVPHRPGCRLQRLLRPRYLGLLAGVADRGPDTPDGPLRIAVAVSTLWELSAATAIGLAGPLPTAHDSRVITGLVSGLGPAVTFAYWGFWASGVDRAGVEREPGFHQFQAIINVIPATVYTAALCSAVGDAHFPAVPAYLTLWLMLSGSFEVAVSRHIGELRTP